MDTQPYIRTIEWEMLDKRKFIPMSIASSFSIRCLLYPFTVIKTRLQVSAQCGSPSAALPVRLSAGILRQPPPIGSIPLFSPRVAPIPVPCLLPTLSGLKSPLKGVEKGSSMCVPPPPGWQRTRLIGLSPLELATCRGCPWGSHPWGD